MSESEHEAADSAEQDVAARMWIAAFRHTWSELAEQGKCDGPDGAEFRRVYEEYMAAGFPVDVKAFIIEAANRGHSSR